ncbi:MAG: carboxypeptidase regulatory-like domain-containing protein, partial [Planctomycetales bacterium]|nr:carboxypeptidase regulatory-like domain-containing protein [Planctomycetales bacterium]
CRSKVCRSMVRRGLHCATLAMLVGCGNPDLVEVRGQVANSQGQPLVRARVIARCEATNVAASGLTDADGRFSLALADGESGLPPGAYQAIVVEDLGPMDSQLPPSISPKYHSVASSGLNLNLAPGEDQNVQWTLDAP